MLNVSKNGLTISFDEATASASFTAPSGAVYCQKPSDFRVLSAAADDSGISFVLDCEKLTLSCRYEIKTDETGTYINLDLSSEDEFDGMLRYPTALCVSRGERIIDPYCEDMAFCVEDVIRFDEEQPLFAGSWNSMSFWTIARGEDWVMTAVPTNKDAYLIFTRNEEGLYENCIGWQDEMYHWGYTRSLRYYFGKGNPVTDCAKTYRKVAIQLGKFKTLKEKAEAVPTVDRAIGCGILWLWNDDAMHKLFDKDAKFQPPTEEQLAKRRKIAKEMKDLGMDDLLWSIFDEYVDRETVDYVKSLGYPTSMYQIYTDVMPKDSAHLFPEPRVHRNEKRMPLWPQSIMIQKDGTMYPAWELTGKDGKRHEQHRMCDTAANAMWVDKAIREEVADNGIEGVMMDVCWCCTLECHSKDHPQSRTQAIRSKEKIFEKIQKMGLLRGTENGHEDCVCCCEYNEGMMSPSNFRSDEAGRRMATLYADSEIADRVYDYGLNPRYRVPLWELVFHDCQATYWYWGDSSNSMPSLTKLRDAFNVLYGTAPMYSFNVSNWEKLKELVLASYQRTVPSARALRYAQMTDFCYLTPDMTVQKTEFSDGTVIVANFGDEDFSYEGKAIGKWETVILK